VAAPGRLPVPAADGDEPAFQFPAQIFRFHDVIHDQFGSEPQGVDVPLVLAA